MTLIRNIIIIVLSTALSAFFVYGSFVYGKNDVQRTKFVSGNQIKKMNVTVTTDEKGVQNINYSSYQTGATTGFASFEFGRLASAFLMNSTLPAMTFSGTNTIQFQGLQGIVSLYDPFTSYSFYPTDMSYKVNQITNGSFYISDEPDGTVSLYSIDIVAELSFLDQGAVMTDMILFPGMYIRFDPRANRDLRGADLFRIMLVLSDQNNQKTTGLEFVSPRIDNGRADEPFFMSKLSISTRPLFQMLHLMFYDRINQVNLIKNYSSNQTALSSDVSTLIKNPNKKNHYLLSDLRSVLSRAVQSQMDPQDFRKKIEKIHIESEQLVKGNSVQVTLEEFLTDARFAIFGGVANAQFGNIYIETASILGITPENGKGKFFQYLSDIYSRNILSRKQDSTFSRIDTYTPTADELQRTLNNENIESKDYFDIALYAYQLLQKAQDNQLYTLDALESRATYTLMVTLFDATGKYIHGLGGIDSQKSAYQSLVIQFYAPIANLMSRSLYTYFTTHIDGKVYLSEKYLDGDQVKFDPKMKENIESVYIKLKSMYMDIAPLYGVGEQQYTLISLRDSITRIGGFIDLLHDGNYRNYQKAPYAGMNIGGIYFPIIGSDGTIQRVTW